MLVAPPNGALDVGDNAQIVVRFSKPVDPLTVNAATVKLSSAGATIVDSSLTFAAGNASVTIVPQGTLPDSTQLTLSISGVLDPAGNSVAPWTSTFTTGPGPNLVGPVTVTTSPYNGATLVPTNAPIWIQVNEPLDPGSVTNSSFQVYNNTSGTYPAGALSVTPMASR